MKKRVKMLTSIAGLGDPQPKDLAARYAKMERDMRSKVKKRDGVTIPVYSHEQIEAAIREEKRKDDAEPRRGFASDFSFKPGDEPLIDADVAEKWEAAGICVAVTEPSRKAA